MPQRRRKKKNRSGSNGDGDDFTSMHFYQPLDHIKDIKETDEYDGFQPIPGPGAYKIPSTIGTGMKKSISFKTLNPHEIKTSTGVPGPKYDVLQWGALGSDPTKGVSIKGKPKPIDYSSNQDIPGPGKYSDHVFRRVSSTPSFSIGKGSRMKWGVEPTQGFYCGNEVVPISRRKTSPSYTISHHRPATEVGLRSIVENPGPGRYAPEKTRFKVSSKHKRSETHVIAHRCAPEPKRNSYPSPNEYKPKYEATSKRRRPPAATFGRSSRRMYKCY